MTPCPSRAAWRRALAAAAFLSVVGSAAHADYRLTVLHVGDLQSRLEPVTETGAACAPGQRCYGGAARLAARIRAERGRGGNVVVLNTGNALTGPYYDRHKQRAVADALNLVGFDAMTVGERDFVDGTEMLGHFQRTARFPLLGANIDLQRDPHMRDRLYPFLATVVGGEQLALIGYSTEQLIARARPTGVIKVEPIETALRRWMEQLKLMGVNKVVAISAAGRERDREIAATIEGLDVVVGTSPEPTAGRGRYLVVHKGPGGQPVLMVQSDAFGRSLGRLDVAFDATGVPKSWQGDALELVDGPEDPAVKALVAAMGGGAQPMPAPGPAPIADRRAQPPAFR